MSDNLVVGDRWDGVYVQPCFLQVEIAVCESELDGGEYAACLITPGEARKLAGALIAAADVVEQS